MEELMRIFSSLEFASPFYFWIGGAAIIFSIFFPILRTKKNLRWDRSCWIKKVPELKGKKPWLLFILMGVTSLLIAAAFANPQIVEKRSIPLQGKPVMILFDVSGSINPAPNSYGYDYAPTKDVFSAFKAGRDVYYDIIKRDTGATIGLSLFSDQSYIARDFAEKLELLGDTLENEVELQEISQGTMTAEALFNVRMYFSEKVKTENKAIILISDLIDDLDSVSQEMKQVLGDGINLYVIAVTEDSASAYKSIQTLKSKIVSNKAKMIWFKDEGGVDKICEEISKMESSQTGEVEILSRRSLVPFILPSILGLIILSLILSEAVFRKIP